MSSTVAERGWCVIVPHHARGARIARHRLTSALRGIVPAGLLIDAVSVASELVGNAVRHAAPLPGDVVRVAWRTVADGGVEIRVTDGGSTAVPEVRDVPPDAISGRGLTIVDALAHRWGTQQEDSGHCVWAELR